MNNCYINGYRDKYKCIPNHNKLHTLIIDDNSTYKFCDPEIDLKNIEIILKRDCDSKCGDPCIEVFFDSSTEIKSSNTASGNQDKGIVHNFIITDTTYTKVKYIAKITMLDLVVRLFNIWNLWHGTHLLQIMSKLNQWIVKALRMVSSITTIYHTHFITRSKLNFSKMVNPTQCVKKVPCVKL